LTGSELFKSVASSVANIIIMRGGQRVSSGTGFVIGGKLVTCAHVVTLPPGLRVRVEFEKPAQNQTASWEYQTLANVFQGYSAEQSFDYAILNPPVGAILPPNLSWANELPGPGEPVCGLGYPFEDPHLTLHHGYVSALFRSGPATMLKLDMSVNPSNSGGPLLRMSDGAVVGVVARKATGLTHAFKELMESYDANIQAFQGVQGMMQMGPVDPIAAIIAGQNQMKVVSAEIQRSANVGIGYAIWIEPLRQEAELNPH
jgi:S1-C subfamily serine protease